MADGGNDEATIGEVIIGEVGVETIGVGIIGCGNISDIYLKNLTEATGVSVLALADLDTQRASEKAAQYEVPHAVSVTDLLAMDDIELVVNLTIPSVHAAVSLQCLRAGKSVYSEKPLATTVADARQVLEEAASRGLRVGCAPDTFLGPGLSTCRKLVHEGAIGSVVAASAFMVNRGMEHWHGNPEFFYQPGAGPLFDMGPYYLTALVTMLGPVSKVAAAVNTARAERPIVTGPAVGRTIKVGTPTHVSALLTFESGAVATVIFSFDVAGSDLPRIEIYGSEGAISVPDPNWFGGAVRVKQAGSEDWTEVPLLPGRTDNNRGVGAVQMAQAMLTGQPHHASGRQALHVLQVMEAVLQAAEENRVLTLQG